MDRTESTENPTFTFSFTEAERRQVVKSWFQLMVLFHLEGVSIPGRSEEEGAQYVAASLAFCAPMMSNEQQDLARWITDAVTLTKNLHRTPEQRKQLIKVVFNRAVETAAERQIEGFSEDVSEKDLQESMATYRALVARIQSLLLQSTVNSPSLQVSEAGRNTWKWPVIDGPRKGDNVASAAESFEAIGSDGEKVRYQRQLRRDGGFEWTIHGSSPLGTMIY
ncbi:hypothetical protein [Pseudomonas putida]|uniref:hypothetical protein n=1 Tax=Pseudomonas putida TaxID=303 RepID=UPI0037FB66B1